MSFWFDSNPSFWRLGLFLALLFHALLIISFFLPRTSQSPSLGSKNQMIQSYIWRGNSHLSSSQKHLQHSHQTPSRKKAIIKQISQRPNPENSEPNKNLNSATQTPASTAGAFAHDKLAALLHLAIANQISANDFTDTGHVEIAFQLLPNGEIRGAEIATSSGFFQLDQAALQAVKAISPFQPTQKYLSHAEDFMVQVKFSG